MSQLPRDDQNNGSEIAIIGMAGRFPGARNLVEYWRNLRDGIESITFFSDQELAKAGVGAAALLDPGYVKAFGVLDDIQWFDARFFEMNPREAEITDPQQRLFLEVAWEAFEDAGYDPDKYTACIGIYAGVGPNTYLPGLLSNGSHLISAVGSYQTRLANGADFLTTRVSYKLNLRGPSVAVQTACSTSLVAVHLACQSLLNGECDMALAGASSVVAVQQRGYYYQEGGIESPDGHCRAFDANARGTVRGSGVGVVVLKRLEDALADGDTIHAVIKGSAINNDGSQKVGYTAPSIDGQADLIRRAHVVAEVDPESVTYIEAHGTGTPLGDPIEIKALRQAFGKRTERKQYCGVGSVKANIGHLDAAAGVASLIKTVLAMKHRKVPASVNCERPSPLLELDGSPFYINTELREWERNGGPRRAGVSSFGIGGTNAHIVLQEGPEWEDEGTVRQAQVLTLSARSGESLRKVGERLRQHLEEEGETVSLPDVAYTLQVGRRGFGFRRALVVGAVVEAIERFRAVERGIEEGVEVGVKEVGVMFSGQGTQRVWMGRELYERERGFRDRVDEGSRIVEEMTGVDPRKVLYPEEGREREAQEVLRETWMGQPALFVVEYALWEWLRKCGIKPLGMIGHSLGEYVAACVAGVFSFRDGVRLVVERGRLMQSMPEGRMVAVEGEEEEVRKWIEQEWVWLSGVNGGGQCVVSGRVEDIERVEKKLGTLGIGRRRLATRHGFHSGLMEGMLREYGEVLGKMELRKPEGRYLSNVSGEWIGGEAREVGYWLRQIREPVRFGDGLRRLVESGVGVLVEVGPGKVLSGLARRQAREVLVVETLGDGGVRGEGEERRMNEALGRMWERGVEVRWQGLYEGERRRRVSLPTYPFQRERYWFDQNGGTVLHGNHETEVKKRDLHDWFYVPVWRQTPPTLASRAERADTRWLVFSGGDSLSQGVCQALEQSGAPLIVVESADAFSQCAERRYRMCPGRRQDYVELTKKLQQVGQLPQRIVYLWNLQTRTHEVEGDDVNGTAHAMDFCALLNAARELAGPNPSNVRIDVVTDCMQEVSGEEPLRAEQALVVGFCKVIGQEYGNVVCRNIDLVKAKEGSRQERRLIEQLMRELRSDVRDPAVALRGGQRWVQWFEQLSIEEDGAEPRLKRSGVYLITGGLGKIGLELAAYLCLSVKAKVALVGRNPLPLLDESELAEGKSNRKIKEILARISAIEESGGELYVDAAEVGDEARMRGVVEAVKEKWGRLDGVIHAAGVMGHRLIGEIDTETCETVFSPKIAGVNVLERVLDAEKLDFCLLMSSLAALLGGVGLAAYAAANQYMDVFARAHNRRSEQRWISVNWDGWNFGNSAGPRSGPGSGVVRLALTPKEGIDALVRVLQVGDAAQVVVSSGDLKARIEQWANPGRNREPASGHGGEVRASAHHSRPSLSTTYQAPVDEIEQKVMEVWEEILGIQPIGVLDGFFELGGDSLLATQVVSRIRSKLGMNLSIRVVFEEPTVRAMAAAISKHNQDGFLSVSDSKPIGRAKGAGPWPLSYAQQRLWLIHQLEPESAAYNIVTAVRLRGTLDAGTVRQSLAEIERRHDVLRTRFEERNQQIVQVVDEVGQIQLRLWDLSALREGEIEGHVRELGRREAARSFDLARGPVIRANLVRLTPGEHLLLVVMHHVVTDAWSIGILIDEFIAHYEAHRTGRQASLGDMAIQYADYAVWQREWLQGRILEEQLNYWVEQLRGVAVLELPTDRPRSGGVSGKSDVVRFRLEEGVTEGLKEMCRREGITVFMGLLAAFEVVLARYSGQEDIAVGTPIAGRTRRETEGLIGFFVNTLVMRVRMGRRMRVREFLRQVREVALGAYGHQELPFEKLVEHMEPERSLSHEPLFQVMLVEQTRGERKGGLKGVEVKYEGVETRTAKYDLMVTVSEAGEVIEGAIEYRSELYDLERMMRLRRHLRRVVEGMGREVEAEVMGMSLMEESERQQVLVEWSEGERGGKGYGCLHEEFEAQVDSVGDRIAVIDEGGEQLTYRGLNGSANAIGERLRRGGLRVEERVGILMERRVGMVAAMLGVLKAGGAYVPLEGSYPEDRLKYMVEDSGAGKVVTEKEGMREGWKVEWVEAAEVVEGRENLGMKVEKENLAYVIYTSGTTGEPKGVGITHGSAVGMVRWGLKEYCQALDEVAAATSISFDLSIFEIFCGLSYGGRVVLVENPLGLGSVVENEGVKLVNTVPSAAEAVLKAGRMGRRVEVVNLAGEALREELVRELYGLEQVRRLYNLYGPSETTTYSTYGEVGRGEEAKPAIGKPIWDTDVWVLDEAYEAVPIGAEGELCIGGKGLGRGYMMKGGLTAEKFVPSVYAGIGSRMYRTGDKVRWRGRGELEYVGRRDDQVKLHGYRIELGEIEGALRQHVSVKQSVVMMREDEVGEKRLVGYVVKCGEEVNAEDLRRYLRGKLPEYMVPWAIVELEEIPVTANGKLDRKRLPAVRAGADKSEEQARTAIEEIVAGICSDVLGVREVGSNANFFDLGGHSLLAAQVISRVREALGVELGLRALFERPTVRGLAEAVEAGVGRAMKREAIGRAERGRGLPLSYAQQRLWFIQKLEPESAAYNIPLAVRARGELDEAALRHTLREIGRRHEVLRTRFEERGREVVQVIEEGREVEVGVLDLRGLGAEEVKRVALEIVEAEAGRPFDLGQGPVWRGGIVKLGEGDQVLMMSMHHVASDGWSMGLLMKEIGAHYEAYREGESAGLRELAIQYGDYAVWQREWLESGVLDEQLGYWRERLSGAAALELPTDWAQPSAGQSAATVPFNLTADLTEQLKVLSRREGVTLFMALLAGFQVVLGRHARQDDVVVGTSVANRSLLETEHMIGFFVNQLVLRVDLSGNPSVRELLRRAREVTLGAYAHQDIPFEKLVEELAGDRTCSRSPLFQVKLVFQNVPPRPGGAFRGLRAEPFLEAPMNPKFDLMLMSWEAGGCLAGTFSYDQRRFSRGYVESLAAELQEALGILATEPDILMDSLRQRLGEFAEQYRDTMLVSFRKTFETNLSKNWRQAPLGARPNSGVQTI